MPGRESGGQHQTFKFASSKGPHQKKTTMTSKKIIKLKFRLQYSQTAVEDDNLLLWEFLPTLDGAKQESFKVMLDGSTFRISQADENNRVELCYAISDTKTIKTGALLANDHVHYSLHLRFVSHPTASIAHNDPKRAIRPIEYPLYLLQKQVQDLRIKIFDTLKLPHWDETCVHALLAGMEHVPAAEEDQYLRIPTRCYPSRTRCTRRANTGDKIVTSRLSCGVTAR